MGRKRERSEPHPEPLQDALQATPSRPSTEDWIGGSVQDVVDDVVVEKYFCAVCFRDCIRSPILLHGDSTTKQCLACHSCVENLMAMSCSTNHEQRLQCPFCDADITLGAVSLSMRAPLGRQPTNLSSQPGGSSNHLQSSNQCGVCEENESRDFCVQCGFPICKQCLTDMHSKRCFSLHKVVPLDEGRSLAERCSAHPDHTLDLFCNDCHCSTCVLCCFSGSHHGHQVTPVGEAAASALGEIHQASQSLKSCEHRASEASLGLQARSQELLHSLSAEQKRVSAWFNRLRRQMEQCEKQVQQQLQESVQPMVDQLAGASSQCDAIVAQCSTAYNSWSDLEKKDKRVLASVKHPFSIAEQNLQYVTTAVLDQHDQLNDSLGEGRRLVPSFSASQDDVAQFDSLLKALKIVQPLPSLHLRAACSEVSPPSFLEPQPALSIRNPLHGERATSPYLTAPPSQRSQEGNLSVSSLNVIGRQPKPAAAAAPFTKLSLDPLF